MTLLEIEDPIIARAGLLLIVETEIETDRGTEMHAVHSLDTGRETRSSNIGTTDPNHKNDVARDRQTASLEPTTQTDPSAAAAAAERETEAEIATGRAEDMTIAIRTGGETKTDGEMTTAGEVRKDHPYD